MMVWQGVQLQVGEFLELNASTWRRELDARRRGNAGMTASPSCCSKMPWLIKRCGGYYYTA